MFKQQNRPKNLILNMLILLPAMQMNLLLVKGKVVRLEEVMSVLDMT